MYNVSNFQESQVNSDLMEAAPVSLNVYLQMKERLESREAEIQELQNNNAHMRSQLNELSSAVSKYVIVPMCLWYSYFLSAGEIEQYYLKRCLKLREAVNLLMVSELLESGAARQIPLVTVQLVYITSFVCCMRGIAILS